MVSAATVLHTETEAVAGADNNQPEAAAIAAETAIVAAAETAAMETAAAETAVGGGGSADSGRDGKRCGGSGRKAIVNQSVVCFRKYRISGSTWTHKCLPTYT